MLKKVKVKIIDSHLKEIPKYATSGSAGLDLRASIDNSIVLKPNSTELIKTGLSIFIEDENYAAMILPRSGLGHRDGIVLGNLVGLIDSDYQGDLMISCWNRSDNDFEIKPYDRLAQLIFVNISRPQLDIVEDFKKTERGSQGFGSSGKK
mgnify:CR=1 FL=1|tara:strand:- start:28 stop:477 length:450 start_codon:yes stop_codon:yes gene_type:complete